MLVQAIMGENPLVRGNPAMRVFLAIALVAILGARICCEWTLAADPPTSSSTSSSDASGSGRWFTQKSEIAPTVVENIGAAASSASTKSAEVHSANSNKADASSSSDPEKTAG